MMAEMMAQVRKWLRAFVWVGLVFCGDTVFLQAQSVLLDDFQRAASNTVATGVNPWVETESVGSNGSKIRTDVTRLVLGGCNSDNTAPTNGAEQAVLDVSGKYATVFSAASADLVWHFNMRSSNNSLSGFGSNRYGIAFIIGCDKVDFTASNANGYAVVMGGSGSPDPIRLVSFQNGLTANTNLTPIIVSGSTDNNNYYSIRVGFDPCSGLWSLDVRNDGTSNFASPTTIVPAVAVGTANNTFTHLDLKYLGSFWQHGNAVTCTFALFDNIYIPTAAATPATYTWNGASTNFQTAANWTPARSCLRTNDVLQWDASSPANATVTNVPTQTVGQVIVNGNRQVTLRASTTASAKTLSLFGGTGTDLQVPAGSSLTIDSDTALAISLLTSVTADISGNVTFNNTTPPGSPRNHRLLAADANAIVFQSGSIFNATKLSGSPFGTTGTANVVVFKSGSVCVAQDGSNPFGLAQPASKVVFEKGSLYQLKQAVGFAVAGRQYADVEFDLPLSTSSVNLLFGQTNTVCRMDNLLVRQGILDFRLGSNNEPQNTELTGNLTVMANGTLDFTPNNASAKSFFTFNGTTAQTVSGGGTIDFGINSEVVFDNAAGVTLGRNLTANGTAQLKSGVVATGSNELVIGSNAATALTSAGNAHVNGTLRRQVAAAQLYSFPVGNGTNLQKADIQFASLDCVSNAAVRFLGNSPNSTAFTPFTEGGATFSENLNTGYWQITTNCDPATASTYELRLYPVAFAGYPTGTTAYTIAKRTGGGNWQQNGTLSNPAGTATFVQADQSVRRTAMQGFSDFAVAASIVPLPVTWLYFRGVYVDGRTRLTWLVTDEKDNAGFEVQKSSNGKDFETVSFVKAKPATEALNTYSFTDATGGCGYYRLKQTDLNGQTDLSKIVSVECAKPTSEMLALYPNPVSGQVTVVFPGIEPATIRLSGLDGRLLQETTGTPEHVNALLNSQLRLLPAGVYILEMRQGKNVQRQKIVKP